MVNFVSRYSLDNLDDVVAIAIKAEFHTTSLDGSNGGKDLNDRERARLEELFIASRSLVEPVELEHEVMFRILRLDCIRSRCHK